MVSETLGLLGSIASELGQSFLPGLQYEAVSQALPDPQAIRAARFSH
jgi:hypothetical protein